MNAFDLATFEPTVIWGLVSRGVGLVFLISFCSFLPQVLPIAGSQGLLPLQAALRAIERDFTLRKRLLYFPSLFWLNASDLALRAGCWLGVAAAGSIVVGGPHVPWAFAICYALYVSFDRAMTLTFPWDAVLFEAGLWGVLLPVTHVLPELSAVAAPPAAVAWVYRLLAFRVMFGFGKHKFAGSTAQDSGFLRGFLANQPLPTYVGWLCQKLPLGILKFALLGMFLVEIPIPFAVFFPGVFSSGAAFVTLALMLAIWLTGNFGYFNLALMVVVLSWFDNQTASQLSLGSLFSAGQPQAINALFVLHSLIAALALPFNSFCAHTWTLWSAWTRVRPQWLTSLVKLARALAPFHFAHAYGVFPPQSPAPARMTPVAEVSWDGLTWHTLRHRFSPTTADSPPRFCAPHHERFDQAVVYEGIGLNEMSVYRGVIGRWDPYGYGGASAPLWLARRILVGDVPSDRFYDRRLERQRGRPRWVRVRTHMLEPVAIADWRQTGNFWHTSVVGPHFPPMTLDDGYWDAPLPPPELWHFEDYVWLRRSRLAALMQRAAAGEDAHRLVFEGAPELQREDAALFWQHVVEETGARHLEEWSGLRASVRALRERFGRPCLYRIERIANRYGVLLLAKLEPLFMDGGLPALFGRGQATLDVKSIFQLRLLTHHILLQGRAVYDAVMADPKLAIEHAARMTQRSASTLRVLFRYEDFVYQSQKLRLLRALAMQDGRRAPSEAKQRELEAMTARYFGAVEQVEFLRGEFLREEDVLDIPERWPRFCLTTQAEVVRVSASGAAGQRALLEASRE